jgi:hypothetical protein
MRFDGRVTPGATSLAAWAALAALALAGCARSAQDQLVGAVYASKAVPVYQHASYDDAMGGHFEDESGVVVSESQSWFFKTNDPMDKVVAFYEKNFPGATKKIEEDGDGQYVTFTLVPPGAEEGELVEVTLRPGEIQIGEECKPGKIKK